MAQQDGFPRNVPQAEEFQKVTKLDLVVNIDLPQWILTEKISGRRCVFTRVDTVHISLISSLTE